MKILEINKDFDTIEIKYIGRYNLNDIGKIVKEKFNIIDFSVIDNNIIFDTTKPEFLKLKINNTQYENKEWFCK